jgi:hypothetical protein
MSNPEYLKLMTFFVKPSVTPLTKEAIRNLLDTDKPLDLKSTINHWREYDPDPNLAFGMLMNRINNADKELENSSIEQIDEKTLKYFNNIDQFDIKTALRDTSYWCAEFDDELSVVKQAKEKISEYLKHLSEAHIYRSNNDKMYKKLDFFSYTETYRMYEDEEFAYEGIYAMVEALDKLYSKVPVHNKITLFTEFAFDLVNRKALPISEDKAVGVIREYFYHQRNINEDTIEIYANKSLVYKSQDGENPAFITQADDLNDYDDDNLLFEAVIGIHESKKNIGKSASPAKKKNPYTTLMEYFSKGSKVTKEGLKSVLYSIYGTNSDSIINDTPNLLGVVRRGLTVVGAASLSLWLVLPVLLIDMAFANKVDKEQTGKLLKKVQKEQSKVKTQLNDSKISDKKKENLKEYQKVLKQQEERIRSHRTQTMSERENDKELYDNTDTDDEFDFDLDEMCSPEDDRLIPVQEEAEIILEYCDMDLMTMVVAVAEATDEPTEVFLEKAKIVVKKTKENMQKRTFADKIKDKKDEALKNMDENKRKAYIKSKEMKTGTKLVANQIATKTKSITEKEKELSRKLDDQVDLTMMKVKKGLENNRRDAVIKGSIVPSFSKTVKLGIVLAGIAAIDPVLGVIGAVGGLLASKKLNDRQKFLLLDEIEIHLKVTEEKIEKAKSSGDTKALTDLYRIQAKLRREKNRINYGKRGNYIRTMDDGKDED